MGKYIVKINVGQTKMQSIPLPNLSRVNNYIKRNPIGNYKTKVEVVDLIKNKSYYGRKISNFTKIIK
jgi:hypothetical protein